MIRAAAVVALTLFPSLVFGGAQGNWPDFARGQTFKTPSWILVVPAKRMADGTLAIWDRTDPWVRQWIVPQATPGGLRTVAIVGDSEDKRLISSDQLDNMRSAALSKLSRKYKAQAIAVAVLDDSGEAVVAAWSPGRVATWDFASQDGGKKGVLRSLDAIFMAGPNPAEQSVASNAEQTYNEVSVHIVAQRPNPETGEMEYRLKPTSKEAEELITAANGLTVLGFSAHDPEVMEVRVVDGREIEAILLEAGVTAR